jgi:hypothetical protein
MLTRPGSGNFLFTEDELCPIDAFWNLTGASFERIYRRAGLVLVARTLAVLNQADLSTAPPYLENLVANWETRGGQSSRQPYARLANPVG